MQTYSLVMKNLKKHEKVWLACAVDGEGYIYYNDFIDKNGWRNRKVEVGVVNTDLRFLGYAHSLLQGKRIYKQGRRSKKMVYKAIVRAHKDVLFVLEQIKDYLIIKKDYAESVIKFIKKTDWHTQSESAKKDKSIRMKKLWSERKKNGQNYL